jgi:hypothetical protein
MVTLLTSTMFDLQNVLKVSSSGKESCARSLGKCLAPIVGATLKPNSSGRLMSNSTEWTEGSRWAVRALAREDTLA